MKILIVGFTKLKYMPYMHFYLDHLDCERNEVHLLYWNRDGKPDDIIAIMGINKNVILHEFSRRQQDEVLRVTKIASFLKYRKNLLKLLQESRFDRIVVLHTLPGVLIHRKLCTEYQNRFLWDYRDYTYEKIKPFKNIIAKIVNASAATFVSSDGFRSHLPDCPHIYSSHNLLMDSLQCRTVRSQLSRNRDVIRIAYWGFIRHEKINAQMIKKLGNDERFELHYYGREQKTALHLKQYCEASGVRNVFFHGEYLPSQRAQFAAQTDIIHNLYDGGGTEALAMGNKYYDGVTFAIPQLCMSGSFMGKRVDEEQIGLCCNPYEDDFPNRVYQYYQAIDWRQFQENCEASLAKIVHEYNLGVKIQSDFFA